MLQINGEVKINGVNINGLNSPTEQFKDDLVTDIGSTLSPVVGKLDKIVLVDTAGVERDVILNPSVSLNLTEVKVTLSAMFTATSSYNCSRVRCYCGTRCYFEYTFTTPIVISSGSTYRVTYSITINISLTSSSPPGSIDNSNTMLHKLIAESLATDSKRHDIPTEAGVRLYYDVNHVGGYMGCTLSYDTVNNKATITVSWTQTTTITFNRMALYFSDGVYAYYYLGVSFNTTQTITAGTPVTVTFEVTV